MALTAKGLKRVFKMKQGTDKIKLDDPNPSFTPEEVLNFYSNAYPALTTATVSGMVMENDEAVYEFVTTVGTKG